MNINQNRSSWLTQMDKAYYPYATKLVEDLIRPSKLLQAIMGKDIDVLSSGQVKFGNTTTGRIERVHINDYLPYDTESSLDNFAIQFGDDKVGVQGRDLMNAEFSPVDKAHTIQITDADRQDMAGYAGNPQKLVDWIEDSWNKAVGGMTLSILRGILKGNSTGTVVRPRDGATRAEFIGLPTMVGTSSYGGKTTTDFAFWKSWVFDMNSNLFGYTASSQFNTIAGLYTIDTNRKVPIFWDVLSNAIASVKLYSSKPNPNLVVVMHPTFYKNVWMRVWEQMAIPNVAAAQGGFLAALNDPKSGKLDAPIKYYADTYIGDAAVIQETAQINGQYIIDIDQIYILNLDEIQLKAEKSKNFEVTDWQRLQAQYGVWIKSIEATLFFYATRRSSHAKLTLHSSVVTSLKALTGYDFITQNQ